MRCRPIRAPRNRWSRLSRHVYTRFVPGTFLESWLIALSIVPRPCPTPYPSLPSFLSRLLTMMYGYCVQRQHQPVRMKDSHSRGAGGGPQRPYERARDHPDSYERPPPQVRSGVELVWGGGGRRGFTFSFFRVFFVGFR